jgi:hypothetical protein
MVELLFHTTQSDYNFLYIILENFLSLSLSLSLYIYIYIYILCPKGGIRTSMKQQENASKLEEQQKHKRKGTPPSQIICLEAQYKLQSLEQKWIGKKACAIHYTGLP